QERFLAKQEASPDLRKQLNDQYRTWLRRVSELSDTSIEAVTRLSADMQRLIAQLRKILAQHPSKSPSQADLIIALLHMLFNRFFTSGQRLSEGVVYHFLARRYASEKARKRQKHLPVDA
ncbi:MAG: Subtilin biosynthesis protein spaB, partial [Cytophagaceae bacterium]